MRYAIPGNPEKYRKALIEIGNQQGRWELWASMVNIGPVLVLAVTVGFATGKTGQTAFLILFAISLMILLGLFLVFQRHTRLLRELHYEAIKWMPQQGYDDEDAT